MATNTRGSGSVYLWCHGFSGLVIVCSTNDVYLTHSFLPVYLMYHSVAMMSEMRYGGSRGESKEFWKLLRGKKKNTFTQGG